MTVGRATKREACCTEGLKGRGNERIVYRILGYSCVFTSLWHRLSFYHIISSYCF